MSKIVREINRIKNEKVFIIASLLTTLAFAAYNLFLGIAHGYIFGYAIAGYFFFFTLVKTIIALPVKNFEDEPFTKNDLTRPKIAALLLFAVNVSLAAPISMMVLGERTYDLGIIPAIATATYCTVKVTLAIRSYFKKQLNSPLFVAKKASALVDSLVSVLTLQSTLIIANGSANDPDMRVLSAVSSLCLYALIIFVSVKLQISLRKFKNI